MRKYSNTDAAPKDDEHHSIIKDTEKTTGSYFDIHLGCPSNEPSVAPLYLPRVSLCCKTIGYSAFKNRMYSVFKNSEPLRLAKMLNRFMILIKVYLLSRPQLWDLF